LQRVSPPPLLPFPVCYLQLATCYPLSDICCHTFAVSGLRDWTLDPILVRVNPSPDSPDVRYLVCCPVTVICCLLTVVCYLMSPLPNFFSAIPNPPPFANPTSSPSSVLHLRPLCTFVPCSLLVQAQFLACLALSLLTLRMRSTLMRYPSFPKALHLL
jgi:hypothetical protein